MNNDKLEELARLNFEDYIWVVFIILNILNIIANNKQKEFIIDNNSSSENVAKDIYLFIVVVTIISYIYFIKRNYNDYLEARIDEKKNFLVRYLGSVFFMVGILCLLYFQLTNRRDFFGGPEV